MQVSPTMAEQLESRFSDMKAFFKANFGNNAREDCGDDIIKLAFSHGAAPSAEQLESHLSDVK